ncbi:MAG: DUF4365 domain-containing protein [Candidatus Helarchaeota archaeon]|nr:DUF4365 domain-containing protein [Candidatus Helarchaeota archaeon]
MVRSIFERFSKVLPVLQEYDTGIDAHCELLDIPAKPFFIQCKTRKNIREISKRIPIQIEVAHILYWMAQPAPTFLIINEFYTDNCYWMFPEAALEKRDDNWRNQGTVTFKVPKSNAFRINVKE